MATQGETAKPDPVSEAEELLAKATPGPWFWVKARTMQWLHNASGCFASVSMPAFNHRGFHHRPTAEADNELIAAAPDLLRRLCDEVTRRDEALVKIRDSTSDMWACAVAERILKGDSVEDALSHAREYDNT